MLDVFAVFPDQRGAEGLECLAELGDEFGADELFYGGFLFGFAVYVDFELGWSAVALWNEGEGEETYNVLVGLSVMCNLWDADATTDVFAVFCLACEYYEYCVLSKTHP